MAAPPARARADYDYLIKLLLIGDSGTWLDWKPFSRILFFFLFLLLSREPNGDKMFRSLFKFGIFFIFYFLDIGCCLVRIR